MSKVSILVVEDDSDILGLLTYNLRAAGYEVLTCEEGYAALTVAKQRLPDLILLDLMIPGLDGFEVCKELKRSAETRNIPVIMLTARGEEIDRIVGLELGADDYVVKPFSPRELMLRVPPFCAAPRENPWRNRSGNMRGFASTSKRTK